MSAPTERGTRNRTGTGNPEAVTVGPAWESPKPSRNCVSDARFEFERPRAQPRSGCHALPLIPRIPLFCPSVICVYFQHGTPSLPPVLLSYYFTALTYYSTAL